MGFSPTELTSSVTSSVDSLFIFSNDKQNPKSRKNGEIERF